MSMGVALLLTAANKADAKGNGSSGRGSSRGTSHVHSNYGNYSHASQHHHHHHHHSLNRGHNRWSSWYWNSRSRCYYYWSSFARCYYYWYSPANCYYPISYINDYPPPAVDYQTSAGAAPVPVQLQVTNINQNGQNGLPPIAGPGPGLLPPGR
jgi:hypothetical protein